MREIILNKEKKEQGKTALFFLSGIPEILFQFIFCYIHPIRGLFYDRT
jgi:hypothetical protein